MTVSVFTA
ncbi:hypothetical protein VCHC81A2_2021, partial [Vibrio cholerae HC-81A2]